MLQEDIGDSLPSLLFMVVTMDILSRMIISPDTFQA